MSYYVTLDPIVLYDGRYSFGSMLLWNELNAYRALPVFLWAFRSRVPVVEKGFLKGIRTI